MAIKKTSKSKSQPKVPSSPPAKGKGSPTASRGMGSSRTARGSARPGPLTRASIWLRGLRGGSNAGGSNAGGSKAGGSQASRSKAGGSASAGRSASAPSAKGKPAPPPARSGISLDRKLDIIGIVLVVIGLLTLLSLVSQRNSIWTGSWVRLLGRVFGLGMYLFPLALLAGGGWLVLRNFERVPRLAAERVIGILLLFTNLLAWLHLGMATYTRLQVFDLAQAGRGGGYLGAAVIGGLEAGLGLAGAVTVLLGWLLIGLALTLDVSVLDLFGWIPPLIQRLQDGVIERTEARREGSLPARPAGDLSADGSYYTREAPSTLEAGGLQPGGLQPGGLQPLPAMRTLPEGPAYILPAIADILEPGAEVDFDDEIDRSRARVIEETLASFGAPAHVVEINRGPTITQFGVEPDFVEARGGQKVRVRVGKIASLVDDLALALSARTIRIQAPVPGKSFVGIEVPNDEIALVALRDVMESEAFKRLRSPLRFALGQNVAGNAMAADLAAMPHLLVAGATGSGKSVCVNALICDLLLNNTPDDLRLIMVDPKRVELTGYNGIPHLLAPVVVEMERVVGALGWIIREMDLRYRKLAEAGCRNIQDYNTKMPGRGVKKLPYLVMIIDELADLMLLAPDETERSITRLAQLARATGIHLVIATQRPSVDVVTGLIKANFPARIAFAVASGVDSRVILDQPGAERLLGRGDMLFQAPDAPAPVRLQGVFVSDAEIHNLVSYWQQFSGPGALPGIAAEGIVDARLPGIPLKQMAMWDDEQGETDEDPMMPEAIDLIRREGRASVSMLQRRLRIGYTRSARLIEEIEARGIIGPPEPGSGVRAVLDYGPAAPPANES